MNVSGTAREDGAVGSTVPCLAITAGGGMQVEDDIGVLDETQVQEPGSKRHKEGNAAKQSSSWSSHIVDLVDLHTLVAEHGDVSHGAVGRDQARRGQPVAKLVTQSVRHRDRGHHQHREKDRGMLARVKELVGDDDKLLVEYQLDIDIDIESELPKLEFDQEFDQELEDCVEVPRRVSRRVLRLASLRESRRAWLRVQVCLRGSFRVWLRVCIHVSTRRARMLCHGSGESRVDNRDCKRMRLQIAHTSVALNKANASAHSVSSTTPLTRTTQSRCGKQEK